MPPSAQKHLVSMCVWTFVLCMCVRLHKEILVLNPSCQFCWPSAMWNRSRQSRVSDEMKCIRSCSSAPISISEFKKWKAFLKSITVSVLNVILPFYCRMWMMKTRRLRLKLCINRINTLLLIDFLTYIAKSQTYYTCFMTIGRNAHAFEWHKLKFCKRHKA